ncbi:MAG: hypothetical protein JNN05_01570, partial [Candidatus Omnitrophica bacterium]|nr:hypothetical protein [Candidatus Omnitrophota bacterium]
TRDKVFKYIKLITGMDCPFSESNSDEMRFIFKDIEDFRDAIVHPNIFSFSGTAYKPKMNGHLRLCHEFALEAVDKTIKLIRIIDKMVAKDRKSRLFWMFDRTADGVFPEEAFL